MIFLSTLLVKRSLQGKGQLGPVSFLFVCFLSQAHATHFTIMLATASLPFVNITKKLNTIFVLPTLLTISTYAKRHEKKKKPCDTKRSKNFLWNCNLADLKKPNPLAKTLAQATCRAPITFSLLQDSIFPWTKGKIDLCLTKKHVHTSFFFFSNDQSSSMELKLQKQA